MFNFFKRKAKKYTTGKQTVNRSIGYRSTGYGSTGDNSTGDFSTGQRSTGDFSTGHRSTGYRSTGECSTGDNSTGNYSTGRFSTGHRSTGNWSISDYSTGHFSTIDYSGFGAFDKPCTHREWDKALKPSFLYFRLTKWVYSSDMTKLEKKNNPSYKKTDGFLKVFSYQEAFRNSWDALSEEDKKVSYKMLTLLPNWDEDIFEKIAGFRPSKLVL